MKTPSEEEVLSRFRAWADAEPAVRAALLTSSRVNPDREIVDVFSDYDIELYVDDLAPYWQNDDWLAAFGPILVRCPWQPASYKDGWLTRMAVFKDGFRIDFQMTDQGLAEDHYVDGFRVLLDKDGITEGLKPPTYEGYRVRRPGLDEWQKLVNEFWWDAVYVAKSLARDELFYAKFSLDWDLRFNFFQKLIEWTICIEHGWDTQPNKYGRFFKRYVDGNRWAKIESTFAGADIEANWQALFAALALFRELAREASADLGYPYPETVDEEVTAYIEEIRKFDGKLTVD